jgi:hypothetical protein
VRVFYSSKAKTLNKDATQLPTKNNNNNEGARKLKSAILAREKKKKKRGRKGRKTMYKA